MKKVVRVEEDIIKISSDVCLTDIYTEIEGYELLVEPLSKKQPISEFIYEGGMGFNSMTEGSLTSKIFKLKGTAFSKEFEYGLGYHPLYNVGYPLHRMMTRRGVYRGAIGSITELTLPIQPKKEVEIEYLDKEISEVTFITGATNVMYVNDIGADIMGLKTPGVVVTYSRGIHPNNKEEEKIWERRFIEDEVPGEHCVLKALTTVSNVKKIRQTFSEKLKGLFAVLLTNMGPLLVISVEKAKVKDTVGLLSTYPMTYLIREA